MRKIKKIIGKVVLTGVLAAGLACSVISTNVSASTVTNPGTYTTVSITRTATGASTVSGSATGSNKTASAKYVSVYVKAGSEFASAKTKASSNGVVNAGSSRSASATGINSSLHCYGQSVIHSGTSSSTSTLESKCATN